MKMNIAVKSCDLHYTLQ